MDNEQVDKSKHNQHNADINGYDEVIKLDEIKRINDPDCEHEFKEEPDDEFDGYTAWTCRKCGRGTYLPDGVVIT